MFLRRDLFLICILIQLNCRYLKLATANAVFRFDFNLNIKENSFKTSLKVGKGGESNEDSIEEVIKAEASSPVTVAASSTLVDIWSKQAQLNATANDKLQATVVAVAQLQNEISVVSVHSKFIAEKSKLMARYLNKVNAFQATNTTKSGDTGAVVVVVGDDDGDGDGANDGHGNAAAANQFLILQDYMQLVDDLRAPPTEEEAGEHSLDYTVMKLGLEKHKLIELQTQILLDVLQAMETWQMYVKQQLIDVATV